MEMVLRHALNDSKPRTKEQRTKNEEQRMIKTSLNFIVVSI